MGYLVKNGQKNKMSFKRRWFLLVSSFSLSGESLEPLLAQEQLPSWLQMNVLYYFDSPGEKSTWKGKVSLSKATAVTKHDTKSNS